MAINSDSNDLILPALVLLTPIVLMKARLDEALAARYRKRWSASPLMELLIAVRVKVFRLFADCYLRRPKRYVYEALTLEGKRTPTMRSLATTPSLEMISVVWPV